MLLTKRLFSSKKFLANLHNRVVCYSRKSNANDLGSYKVVKSNDVVEADAVDLRFGASPNWELFAPRGYRFMLPGSLGPAWHEPGSMVPVDDFHESDKKSKFDFDTLECTAQECPLLLRKGVTELFPGTEAGSSQQMTVVSLSQKRKKNSKQGWKCKEVEVEYNAKTFMWAAQEICVKLKMSGYWADFINPFSGRPYLSPFYNSNLYETDSRFRCIGFEIESKGRCKVIQPKPDSWFIGSLFTNAPANASFLMDILSEDLPNE